MTIESLEAAFAATRTVLAEVTPERYGDPTPCASWTVRDLVNHIVEGANWFPLCVEAAAAPDPDPTHGVDYAAGDAVASFDAGAAAALAAFAAPGAQERMIVLPFGELPGSVFMGIATNDMVVHGWDLARATGQPYDVDPEQAVRLLGVVSSFADTLRGPEGAGAFGPAVEAPEGATPLLRLVAYLGRQP